MWRKQGKLIKIHSPFLLVPNKAKMADKHGQTVYDSLPWLARWFVTWSGHIWQPVMIGHGTCDNLRWHEIVSNPLAFSSVGWIWSSKRNIPFSSKVSCLMLSRMGCDWTSAALQSESIWMEKVLGFIRLNLGSHIHLWHGLKRFYLMFKLERLFHMWSFQMWRFNCEENKEKSTSPHLYKLERLSHMWSFQMWRFKCEENKKKSTSPHIYKLEWLFHMWSFQMWRFKCEENKEN